ncbi:hypothetical protein LTR66_005713 [Elasticomyces elasticus]|nr:hypothetical protein LTR66_005713 [Elasticomyces elasticus]
MTFMLISYVILPAHKTRSHYLSVCLIVAVLMITIGFIIPLGSEPQKCYDAITPNDMYSSSECAWSGAFIIAGGLCATTWVLIRALSMHLQICWDTVPGRKFFYASQALGWGIPAVLFTATLTVTGVSSRFGDACHVNHKKSMGDFWGPLLAFAGSAVILQLATFGYCVHVYLKNLRSNDDDSVDASGSGGLPSYSASVRTQTARVVYHRLKKVLWLQWRGIAIVTIILVDVIFFSIVFVYLDDISTSAAADIEKVYPWLLCLVEEGGDKKKCLGLAAKWLVNEQTVIAVLLLLSASGMQVFLLLFRWSFIAAWSDLIRTKLSRKREFVSLDAISHSNSAAHATSHQGLLKFGQSGPTFEMQKPNKLDIGVRTTALSPTQGSDITSPAESYHSPLHFGRATPDMGRGSPDYFGRKATRQYRTPTRSFSSPQAPSRQSSVKSAEWDPRSTHARGGLVLPPTGEDETESEGELRHRVRDS